MLSVLLTPFFQVSQWAYQNLRLERKKRRESFQRVHFRFAVLSYFLEPPPLTSKQDHHLRLASSTRQQQHHHQHHLSFRTTNLQSSFIMLVRQNRLVSSTLRVIGTRALSSNKGLQPNEKDVQMPTPLSIGFDITFQQANSNSPNPDGARRPLAVVAGWLGAKPRQLKPYLEFYHKNNIDTLSFAVGPHHILFPTKAEEQMVRIVCAV